MYAADKSARIHPPSPIFSGEIHASGLWLDPASGPPDLTKNTPLALLDLLLVHVFLVAETQEDPPVKLSPMLIAE